MGDTVFGLIYVGALFGFFFASVFVVETVMWVLHRCSGGRSTYREYIEL